MSNEPSITSELLDDRYGRGKRRGFDRRFAWAVGALAVFGGLTFVVFGGWQTSSNLEYKDLDYAVIDDRSVQVTVQVTAPADRSVVCAVEALSQSFATVGWKLFEVPPGEQRIRRFTTTIVTTTPANTGTVRECWVESH